MTHGIGRGALALVCGLPLLLIAACSGQTGEGSAAGTGHPLGTACPIGGPPPIVMRVMMMLPGTPKMVISTTTAPGDTSTSTVITPDPRDQIRCGKAALTATSNVVFSTPTLANGNKKSLKMDILAPKGVGPRPAVVYIPGGGFMIAAKESALDLRTFVAESGFVVASIQYRTTGDHADYRDGVADAKSAIRFLRAHAGQYGIDPTRIAVWGESAGGYLAAMAGVTSGQKSFDVGDNLSQSSDVQAVVDKFGASDVSRIAEDFDAKAREAFAEPDNRIMGYMNGQASTAGNPITYIHPSTTAWLIFHGSQDRLISPSQTLVLHNALRAAGVPSERYVINGAGHGDLAFLGDTKAGLPWSTNQVMGVIVDFLKREIGGGQGQPKT